MVQLFSPFSFGGVELSNRVIVSPMSQYSAIDGCATDWHFVHYGSLANSGAALVMVESTHVDAQARGTTDALVCIRTGRKKHSLALLNMCTNSVLA